MHKNIVGFRAENVEYPHTVIVLISGFQMGKIGVILVNGKA